MSSLNESVYENPIKVGLNAAESRPNVRKSENLYEIAEKKCKYTC